MMNISKIKHKIKQPKFLRQNAKNLKRLHGKWRKPKGNQSKQRQHRMARGAMARIGYGMPKTIRGMHPLGMKEIIVHNPAQLKIVAPDYCVRIGSTVGKKKRIEITKVAEEMKLKIVNKVKQ